MTSSRESCSTARRTSRRSPCRERYQSVCFPGKECGLPKPQRMRTKCAFQRRNAWHKGAPKPFPGTRAHMIRLDNIGKQHGKQILFIEASAAAQQGREGRPRRPQRRRQDHALPDDHRRGAARRGPGLGRSRRHHRLLQPGRRRDGGPQRRGRGDGRRRPGEHRGGRAEGARARHGRSRTARTRWTSSSSASARCRRASRSSAATRSRAARARSSPASASARR